MKEQTCCFRNTKLAEEKIATMEQNITKYETELKAMKSTMDETESDAQQLLVCIEEITGELEDSKNDHAGKTFAIC